MGRRERTGAVNETRSCAVSAGWPGALTPALLRAANIQKRCRLHRSFSKGKIMRALAI